MPPLLDLIFAPICLGCAGPIARDDAIRLVCRRCRSRLRPPPEPCCDRCGAPALRVGRLPEPTCGECKDWPPSLRAARSACLLHPPADRLVHQLKYRGWHALAQPLAERMANLVLPRDAREEARIVIPVPTTPPRLRERGYNQAERLAAAYVRLTSGRPTSGRPASSLPASGRPTSGRPASGRPTSGHPTSGHPTSDHPTSDHPTLRVLRPLLSRAGASATQTALQPVARGANVAGAFRVVDGGARQLRGEHVLLIDDVLTTGATAIACTRALIEAGARCVTLITFARALDTRRLTTN